MLDRVHVDGVNGFVLDLFVYCGILWKVGIRKKL